MLLRQNWGGRSCEANASEKECGGAATMLAYAFTCDRSEGKERGAGAGGVGGAADAVGVTVGLQEFHNPATSFSMRIDLRGI